PKPFIPNTAHSQEQESMLESLDFRLAIGPVTIPDRNFHDFQILLGRAEQEIEVAKRIEVAEEVSAGLDLLIVSLEQRLRPTEGVPESLLQEPGKDHAEDLVADQIEQAHRLARHGTHHAAPVSEFAMAFNDRVVKLGERLRIHAHVCVQDDEQLPRGRLESFAHRIALPNAFTLVDQPDRVGSLIARDAFLDA